PIRKIVLANVCACTLLPAIPPTTTRLRREPIVPSLLLFGVAPTPAGRERASDLDERTIVPGPRPRWPGPGAKDPQVAPRYPAAHSFMKSIAAIMTIRKTYGHDIAPLYSFGEKLFTNARISRSRMARLNFARRSGTLSLEFPGPTKELELSSHPIR